MSILPLAHPLNGDELITTTCQLYRQSLLKVLPITLLMAGAYLWIRFGGNYLPTSWGRYHQQFTLLGILLFLPLSAMLWSSIDKIAKQQPIRHGQEFLYFLRRFLSFMGCIISMLLFPGFLLGLGIAGYFFLGIKHTPYIFLYSWMLFTALIIFMSFIPKIFGPALVLTDRMDANSALDLSANLVKGFYWRTFYQIFYGVLLLVFVALLGHLGRFYFSHVGWDMSWQIWQGLSILLLVLLTPWSFTLVLVHQYDLQLRKKPVAAAPPPKLQAEKLIQTVKGGSDQDKFSF